MNQNYRVLRLNVNENPVIAFRALTQEEIRELNKQNLFIISKDNITYRISPLEITYNTAEEFIDSNFCSKIILPNKTDDYYQAIKDLALTRNFEILF